MDKSIYRQRVEALRKEMIREGIDVYMILTDDFHASEYVGDYFKCREYVSGFDGSAGVLAVTGQEACLWTDGRYFLQAADQLEDTGIELMKMGEKGVPTVDTWLKKVLEKGGCLGYDGRTVSSSRAGELKKLLSVSGVSFREDTDLVGRIWKDRPGLPEKEIWLLDAAFTGMERRDKLDMVREDLKKERADWQVIASLDDIGWLFNIRGGDIDFNPVPLAFAMIGKEETILYAAPSAVSPAVRAALEKDGVVIRPYLQIFGDLKGMSGVRVIMDLPSCSAALSKALPSDCTLLDRPCCTTAAKARKNPVEMENIRNAHIRDGVAVTKLLFWLDQPEQKKLISEGKLTELDVSGKLLSLRRQQPDFVEQSFGSIIAAGSHGAIIHYEPTEETNIPVQEDTFLLMDTGGHYLQGTTDITRTVVIGSASQDMKKHYTAVLRGHLDLASAVFRSGTGGLQLDLLARAPLWEIGLDFNHGTGHGVGYLMNVHEGPQRIANRGNMVPFEEGMLTSDEPGVYLTGRYGIRIENLMLCTRAFDTETGRFLNFETVTMVPYDRRAIDPSRLTEKEIVILNSYHEKVYRLLSPFLTFEECSWLRAATQPLQR